jgi:predicted secreted hydrolase
MFWPYQATNKRRWTTTQIWLNHHQIDRIKQFAEKLKTQSFFEGGEEQ